MRSGCVAMLALPIAGKLDVAEPAPASAIEDLDAALRVDEVVDDEALESRCDADDHGVRRASQSARDTVRGCVDARSKTTTRLFEAPSVVTA